MPATRKPARTRPLSIVRPDLLADRLAKATAFTGDRLAIALCAAATGVLTLGAPDGFSPAFLSTMAALPDTKLRETLAQFWSLTEEDSPFLRGHLGPLTTWMNTKNDGHLAAFRRSLDVLSAIDLAGTATAADGEILGPLYTFLRSKSDIRQLGAFFTPMSVSRVIAAMTWTEPVDGPARNILEPACGAGGMAIALAKVIRERGDDPARHHWVLNDLDRMAVALAGVNAVIHGLGPGVRLCSGNGLLLGSGQPGDPLLAA